VLRDAGYVRSSSRKDRQGAERLRRADDDRLTTGERPLYEAERIQIDDRRSDTTTVEGEAAVRNARRKSGLCKSP
jgi:hypothetical protein